MGKGGETANDPLLFAHKDVGDEAGHHKLPKTPFSEDEGQNLPNGGDEVRVGDSISFPIPQHETKVHSDS